MHAGAVGKPEVDPDLHLCDDKAQEHGHIQATDLAHARIAPGQCQVESCVAQPVGLQEHLGQGPADDSDDEAVDVQDTVQRQRRHDDGEVEDGRLLVPRPLEPLEAVLVDEPVVRPILGGVAAAAEPAHHRRAW